MARSDDLSTLTEIASEQAGYVTTRQAGRLGVEAYKLSRLSNTGDARRVRSGVYALRHARHRLEDGICAWLSIDRSRLPWERDGEAVAVLSHGTAASLLDLGTIIPRLPALTVPLDRRSTSRARDIELHVAPLAAEDWMWQVDETIRLPTTTSARTIVDLFLAREEPSYVTRAIVEAIQRDTMTPSDLLAAAARRKRHSGQLVERLETLLGSLP
jgi:predicted transcriptional regulator of viral defense system